MSESIDTIRPYAFVSPLFLENSFIRYGCGPAVYAHFDFPLKDASDVWVEAEIQEISQCSKQSYFIPLIDETILNVGHGMCGGAFSYEIEKNYRVRFRPSDISGNQVRFWTEWMEIENPMN